MKHIGLTFGLMAAAVVAFAQQPQISHVIQTPNPCVEVERVEAGDVFLKSSVGACAQTISHRTVKVDAEMTELNIYLDGEFWRIQRLQRFDVNHLDVLMGKAKEKQASMSTLASRHHEKAMDRAKKVTSQIESPIYQKRIDVQKEKVKSELYGEQVNELLSKAKLNNKKKRAPGSLPEDERIYIFISSSMPKNILRSYISKLDKVRDQNVIVVMRGFIGGAKYIKPTFEYFQELLAKDPSCLITESKQCEAYLANIQVDPSLFSRYGITQVPAVTYVQGALRLDGAQEGSEGDPGKFAAADHWTVYGDAEITYLLEKINSDAKSDSLRGYVAALNKGFY